MRLGISHKASFLILLVGLVSTGSTATGQDFSADSAQTVAGGEPMVSASRSERSHFEINNYRATRQLENSGRFGLRSYLQQSGITLSAKSTQFAFGVDGGINVPVTSPLGSGDTFKYTGRNEYGATLDLDKLAGLSDGRFRIRVEHWYGEYGSVTPRTGAFAPAVFAAELPPAPEDPGTPFLTEFAWTQPLTERLTVFVGKMSGIGAADQNIFAGGDGTDQFSNMALIESPALLLGIPYSSFSAGFKYSDDQCDFVTYLYDPTDRTTELFNLTDLFSAGVIVGSEVRTRTDFFSRQGQHHIGAVWKHVKLTDLRFNEPPPGVYPEPTVPGFPTLSDSWTLYYGFDQYFVEFSDDPNTREGWGLFGRASLSDGNPTPVRYFLSLGLGGDSRLRYDKKDRWGIGWYYVGISGQFGPAPQAQFGPRDGTGVELFYNFQVTRFLNVTPDIQFIRPEASALADKAFVYGVRASISW